MHSPQDVLFSVAASLLVGIALLYLISYWVGVGRTGPQTRSRRTHSSKKQKICICINDIDDDKGLLLAAKHFHTTLLVKADKDEDVVRVLDHLGNIGIVPQLIPEHRVLSCSTFQGKISIVRQLPVQVYIGSKFIFV